jgi:exopolyphosphatase/guanosine-5'-triphosphate,3'-diphosphate pyrophosphatase
MRVGIIDVGSNTARLLVADVSGERVESIAEERAYLGLGAEIAKHGALAPGTVDRIAAIAGTWSHAAALHGSERLETIVTAPGRQGRSASALVAAIASATQAPVRVLTADEEGRLAYDGATARAVTTLPEVVGVVDVGGGSTELVVGTPSLGPAWVRSVDLGSLLLSERYLLSDPPTSAQRAQARNAARRHLSDVKAPRPDVVLAAGGSARAAARIVGRVFGEDDLREVVRVFSRRPADDAAKLFGISPERAGTVLAGALLLAETSRLLNRPLELARGGLREGAALALAAADALAA